MMHDASQESVQCEECDTDITYSSKTRDNGGHVYCSHACMTQARKLEDRIRKLGGLEDRSGLHGQSKE